MEESVCQVSLVLVINKNGAMAPSVSLNEAAEIAGQDVVRVVESLKAEVASELESKDKKKPALSETKSYLLQVVMLPLSNAIDSTSLELKGGRETLKVALDDKDDLSITGETIVDLEVHTGE